MLKDEDILLAWYVRVLHMDKIMIRLKESECLYEEKLEILKRGRCNSIFPLSIVHFGSNITGYYKISGYRKLGDYRELTAKSLFMAIEKIFQAIDECTQFLIFPEEFVINVNTIYIDERFTLVKIIYIPDDKCKYKNKIKMLLRDLSKITTDEGRSYLERFEKVIEEKNLSYLEAKHVISKVLGKLNKDQTL